MILPTMLVMVRTTEFLVLIPPMRASLDHTTVGLRMLSSLVLILIAITLPLLVELVMVPMLELLQDIVPQVLARRVMVLQVLAKPAKVFLDHTTAELPML
jgi:hypothetical protein